MTNNTAFRSLLRKLMGKGSQVAFGRELGYSQQSISKLLHGQMKPTVGLIEQLIELYPWRYDEIVESVFPRR